MHNRPLARRWPVVSAQKQLQVKVLRSDRAERRRATPRDPLQVRKATHVTTPCGNNLPLKPNGLPGVKAVRTRGGAVSKSEVVESNDNAFEYSGLAYDA